MKILITAPPGLGKSTAVSAVIKNFPANAQGIVARELLDSQNKRIGFISVNAAGQSKQFMSLAKEPGTDSIGGQFNVDIDAIDSFVVPELRKGLSQPKLLLYIDEIGRAQSRSTKFLAVLREIFKSNNSFLATIVYEDEPWSMEFKKNETVCLIELTMKNRSVLPTILVSAFRTAPFFYSLPQSIQRKTYSILQELLKQEHFISSGKLFDNAIPYLFDKKIVLKSAESSLKEYEIQGKTHVHRLYYYPKEKLFVCDCDLANGRGFYLRQSQPCSHQLSVRLMETLNGKGS